MRILIFFISLICLSAASLAADFDIKTKTDEKGQTIFYLQAGAFSKKENAENWKEALKENVHDPINVEHSESKNLFLVQIGPVKDYPTVRALKKELTSKFQDNPKENEIVTDNNNKPRHSDEAQVWNLRNADIRAVIAEVSRITGKNFIIDPRVQGKISIVSGTAINSRELYPVFLSMLQISGYAAVNSGDIIKIVPNIDAKTQASDLLNRMRHPGNNDEMIVEVIPVKFVPAEQLVPVLRPLIPQWSQVSAYAPSNMLILSGRAANIKRMAEIIQQVDSSSASGIDIVPLRHALAMDIANTLKDLVKNQSHAGLRSQTMLAADDRSNSILISGSKTERLRLRLLIAKLDKGDTSAYNSHTKVVYLNYLRAEDVVPILAGVAQANFSGNVGTTIGTISRPALDSTNPASSMVANSSSSSASDTSAMQGTTTNSPDNQNGAKQASESQTEGSTKPSVQLIAEPNTNSIIINAPPTIIRILNSVISQLDIRPAQLLIEALVAEVDQNDINDLGIEWGTDQQTGNPAAFRPGFAIMNSKTNINDFQAQIYALARERKANILSTPSVVVLDNRQAKILVGRQVSIATTTYPNNAGGTTTASPYTTFDRVNVALHLYVRPQITRGSGIQMQIDQGNDTLDPSSGTTVDNQPVFKISSIVTSVHVDSGDVVVLGGLKQDSLANDDNKLPIIGDIPGVGRLFKRSITSHEKRVLLVFIKPTILKNQHDAVQVTTGKYQDVRNEQLAFIREQEVYDPQNDASALPPLHQATLPKPFSNPPQAVIKKQMMPPSKPILDKFGKKVNA